MKPEDIEHLRKMKEESLRKFWMELKPFVKSEDVPQLPIPLTDFHINKLIELGAIAKDKLEDGVWYYGEYRNSENGMRQIMNSDSGDINSAIDGTNAIIFKMTMDLPYLYR